MPEPAPDNFFNDDGLTRDIADLPNLSKANLEVVAPDVGNEVQVPTYDPFAPDPRFAQVLTDDYEEAYTVVPEQLGPTGYSDADIDGCIVWDMGEIVLPVCGPVGTPAVCIQVHAPTAKRVVEWTAGRPQVRPQAPSSRTGNPNDVVTKKILFTNTPTIDHEQTYYHRSSGRYEYAMLKPPTRLDRYPIGVAPWDAQSALDKSITPAEFDDRLLDNSASAMAVSDLTDPAVQAQLDLANYDLIDYVGP